MELLASLAQSDGDKLTVYCAAQLVESAHHSIASTLRIPLENVEVISEFIGGGFGGKLPIYADAILAALAARQLKRPVKVTLTRQQMFSVTTHRAATVQRVRLGARQDGKLTAIAHEVWSQSAPARRIRRRRRRQHALDVCRAQPLTMHRVVAARPAGVRFDARAGRRGRPARDRAGDGRARLQARSRSGRAPAAQRAERRSREQVPFSTRTLVECLQKGAERFGWSQRPRVPGTLKDGHWLIGLGMAAAIRGNLRRPASAKVRMDENRHVTVEMDMTDIGTGSYTIFAQVAAETLGLPLEHVT